jgi:hypothetical protein
MIVLSPIPLTLALWKSKVEMMRTSAQVMPPLAPPSIKELKEGVES